MYAIYGNIYHSYTPVMLAYTSTMDPMGTILYTILYTIYVYHIIPSGNLT